MGEFKFLVLTDHTHHTPQNSLYGICRELHQQDTVDKVVVASRGYGRNRAFFEGDFSQTLYGSPVGPDFRFFFDFVIHSRLEIYITEFDFVLLRLPQPIPSSFLHNIGQYSPEHRIINQPLGVLETSSKAFLIHFKHLTPPIHLCQSVEDIQDFGQAFPIVLKPLYDYGGRGIVKIDQQQVWYGNEGPIAWETFASDFRSSPQTYLAMKYLSNLQAGDKRIVVANGQVLSSTLRYPPEGSWLCNVSQGGKSESSEMTNEERLLVKQITPVLQERGIFIYGLDTLMDEKGRRVLSEINTLSVGGLAHQDDAQTVRITRKFVRLLMKYCKQIHDKC